MGTMQIVFQRLVVFFLLLACVPLLPVVSMAEPESNDLAANAITEIIVTAVPAQRTFLGTLFELADCADSFRLVSLVSDATDPERFAAAPADLELVRQAVLWIQIGHPELVFEKKIEEALSFPAEKLLRQADLIAVNHDDPHIWLSAEANIRMLERVVDFVSTLHPELRDRLVKAESKLKSMIETEVLNAKSRLEKAREKSFVVFHPAWGYLSDELGLRQFHLEDHGKEPSPFALARKISQARQQGIHIVIVQPQFSRTSAEALAKEIDARVFEVNPLGESWFATLQKFSEVFLVGSDGR